jgi:histidine decarboxylase
MNTTAPSRLSAHDRQRLDDLHALARREVQQFVGFPCSALFDYSELYRFLAFPLNNVGDPYSPGNYHLNTHDFEREVLADFYDLTHATADSSRGYVTNGGTEGNMYGIFLARESLPDGLVYYSEDTHYSVAKMLRCMHARSIRVRSLPDGGLDLDDLRGAIHMHRDVPPIVFANIGTTMKGAVDDLDGIHAILHDLAMPRHYIHADAALLGMVLPFVDHPQPWDFRAGIDSIAISGHKMVGSPIPCGVVIAKQAHVDRIARDVDYLGTLDTTLSGSRNAIAPLFLWYAFRTAGRDGFRRRIDRCLEVADYAVERLNRRGCNAWRNENSPIVVFDRPAIQVAGKWQLAVQDLIAHVIAMPHVTREHVDRLAEDIAAYQPEEVGA